MQWLILMLVTRGLPLRDRGPNSYNRCKGLSIIVVLWVQTLQQDKRPNAKPGDQLDKQILIGPLGFPCFLRQAILLLLLH